jgi:hypothetical protein
MQAEESESTRSGEWNPYVPPASSDDLASSPGLLAILIRLFAVSLSIPIVIFAASIAVWFIASLLALSPLERKILGYAVLFYLVVRFSLRASNKGRLPVREVALGIVAGLLIYWM